MADRTGRVHRTRTATFNVYQGQPLAQLIGNLEDAAAALDHPEIIALQEAGRLTRGIRGYDLVGPGGEDGFTDRLERSTQLLVRKDGVTVHGTGMRQVDGPSWRGPKRGILQPPRVFVRVTYSLDDYPDHRWDAFGIHRTPGGPRPAIAGNRDSWVAEDRFIEGWSDARATRHGHPQLWLGDHNGRRGDKGDLSLTDLARRIGGAQLAVKGIDGAIVRGAEARAKKLRRKFGSDGHRPVLVTATVKETR